MVSCEDAMSTWWEVHAPAVLDCTRHRDEAFAQRMNVLGENVGLVDCKSSSYHSDGLLRAVMAVAISVELVTLL